MRWKRWWQRWDIAKFAPGGSHEYQFEDRGAHCQSWVDCLTTPHPPYSPDLALSDFHLFGPMKDGLRGQHFPSNDAAVRAVKRCAISAGADFYECGKQALVHRWRKCVANGGDYVEK